MVNNSTYFKQPSLKTPNRRMLLWTLLTVGLGILATVLVITASANPPNAAEMRLQALVNELREDRLTAQRHAAQRELEAAGDAAVPALTVALRSTDATMRRNAADMLGFIASPGSIGALQNSLNNDTVPAVRRNAAWALGNISSFAPMAELKRSAVLDTSPIVRQTALDSLARVRSRIALSAGIDEQNLSAYAVSPQNANIIYAATKRNLVMTENGGTTWKTLTTTLPSLTTVLTVSPADAQTVYAGVDGLGVFKSINGGRDWAPMNNGLEVNAGARFVVTDLTVDPGNAQRIVIATGVMLGTSTVDFYPTGLRLSTDGGATWHVMNGNSPGEPLTQLAVKGDQVFALAENQVLIYPLD
jgi:hypothetical protein